MLGTLPKVSQLFLKSHRLAYFLTCKKINCVAADNAIGINIIPLERLIIIATKPYLIFPHILAWQHFKCSWSSILSVFWCHRH